MDREATKFLDEISTSKYFRTMEEKLKEERLRAGLR
jgi:hypothetical protein